MPNDNYANEPNQSRSEDIIQSILDNTEYDEEARSRIEYLLIELKNAIEGGGGGGGVTSYAPLTEKPKIDNHTLQAGNNTSSDLGLQTKLTFDSVPTENSTNPVTSDGVYTALGAKANSSDVYNKSAVDTALTAKADKSTTYTKSEVDTALGSKQNAIDSSHKLSADLVDDTNATNKFATAEELEQIQTNENNISTINAELIELVDSGAKNKLPNKGSMTKDDITYTWTNGDVIVSGTKTTGTNYVAVMPFVELTSLGLNVGDKFIISNNGTICYLTIIFWSQSQGYTSSIDVLTGSTEITVPTGYTHIIARLGALSTATGIINETIQPMICSKAAWDVSQKYVPYAPTNAELYAMIQALQP